MIPHSYAIAILSAIMVFGAAVRIALIEIGDTARVAEFCTADSDSGAAT